MSRDLAEEAAILRERLADLLRKCDGADRMASSGAFLGGARWRRVTDDLAAGRLHFRGAWRAAKSALAALDALVDDEGAADALAEVREAIEVAEDFYTSALEAALGAKGLAALRQSAKERGRAPSASVADRNRRLAEAVDRQIAADPTMTRKQARSQALDDDPGLAEAFRGSTDPALRQALRRKNGYRN